MPVLWSDQKRHKDAYRRVSVLCGYRENTALNAICEELALYAVVVPYRAQNPVEVNLNEMRGYFMAKKRFYDARGMYEKGKKLDCSNLAVAGGKSIGSLGLISISESMAKVIKAVLSDMPDD